MLIERIKKNKITIIGFMIVLGFAVLLYVFMHPKTTPDAPVSPDKLVEFNGTELEETKDGVPVWKLTADEIQVDPETEIMYFTNPKAVLYDVNGTEMTITADKGVVDKKKRTIEIKPPVKGQTNLSDTLQTDGSVYYNMDTHMITGGSVVISRHDSTMLRADAFETNTGLDKVKLTGHAQVTKGEE